MPLTHHSPFLSFLPAAADHAVLLQRKLARDAELKKNPGTKKPTAAEKKASDAEAKAAIEAMNASAKNLQTGLETHFLPGAPDEPLPEQMVDGVPVFRGNDLDTTTGTFLSGTSPPKHVYPLTPSTTTIILSTPLNIPSYTHIPLVSIPTVSTTTSGFPSV